jgi:hypothetical protein
MMAVAIEFLADALFLGDVLADGDVVSDLARFIEDRGNALVALLSG